MRWRIIGTIRQPLPPFFLKVIEYWWEGVSKKYDLKNQLLTSEIEFSIHRIQFSLLLTSFRQNWFKYD